MPPHEHPETQLSAGSALDSALSDIERRAVRHAERLVQAEDRQVALRPDRFAATSGEPTLRGVFDQVQATFVTEGPPALRVLRKAEVVNEIETPNARSQQAIELRFVRLEILG